MVIAMTTCSPVEVTDRDAVQAIIDKYTFVGITAEIDENDCINISGDRWFRAEPTDEVEFPEEDFLEELRPYLLDTLIIRMASIESHECSDFADGMKISVSPDEVKYRTLDCDDANILVRLTALKGQLRDMADDSEGRLSPKEIESYIWECADLDMAVKFACIIGQMHALIETAEQLGIYMDHEFIRYAAMDSVWDAFFKEKEGDNC